ncbi:PIF1 helicase [Rhynchospora pubera]|uniref:PIF1 helicase n=1 Tax=Rhynchospora pubera TaxID=906938 RepID=A0AAV8F4S3_9POAL|nr:PIF1 helicase [Rhynchospora pubera]
MLLRNQMVSVMEQEPYIQIEKFAYRELFYTQVKDLSFCPKTKTISSVVLCNDNQQKSRPILDMIGMYLREPVFSHGQLYVALSRTTSPDGLEILITYQDDSYAGII